ncbi:uncharacterized protein BP5553_04915 [Venustampulla echinocandica]|uniref:Uncharacterized protein n=1 Tax=Venustampulla echinocandica TaxID=2656787 RepID=A0A370TPP1_9HELO|nr:uncharacterized protein BP5553_04915 [Venustampulla echinocandica]RDL37482.1 hypothetical protein BP5553_04915 [Venustampulla echinocandica]
MDDPLVTDDPIASQTATLRRHIGLEEREGMLKPVPRRGRRPLFVVECTPYAPCPANCKLATCDEPINFGVSPVCLKEWPLHVSGAARADADFLDRILPVTRLTWGLRKISPMSMMDGNYLCSAGVERLVLEWKYQRGRWIDESDGKEVESLEATDPDLYVITHKAGSSSFKVSGPPPGVNPGEYRLSITALAPYESDGPEDTEEWNLFDDFLSNDKESLNDPHDLSKMLTRWENYMKFAFLKDDNLSEGAKELREEMGEKAIRAIKRLSITPMPSLRVD